MPDIIGSTSNERVKYLRSLHMPQIQRRERAFLVEGVRLVEEALNVGAQPRLVLVDPAHLERSSRGQDLLDRLRLFHPLAATEQVLKAASGTVTPQGVVAAFPIPTQAQEMLEGPLVTVLQDLADPGNAGTILRTAWASGVVHAVGALNSVWVYSPKVVRAAAGAHFHLELAVVGEWTALRPRLAGRRLRVAAPAGGTAYYDVDWREPSALVIGSEAHGVRPEILAAADDLVHIPMRGGAESINAAVAAGILFFEAARQILGRVASP